MTKNKQKAYRLGLNAEKWAAWYLRSKGYRVVAERYRNHGGEIDVLALRGNTLVAVEVKARKTLKDCEYSITPQKQQRMIRAVSQLMSTGGKMAGLTRASERNIRFDVIWVAPWRWPVHIKDAFGL